MEAIHEMYTVVRLRDTRSFVYMETAELVSTVIKSTMTTSVGPGEDEGHPCVGAVLLFDEFLPRLELLLSLRPECS